MVSLPDESALAPDPPACFFPLTALRPALAHGHTTIFVRFSSRLDLFSLLLVIHYPSSTDGVERPFSFITWAIVCPSRSVEFPLLRSQHGQWDKILSFMAFKRLWLLTGQKGSILLSLVRFPLWTFSSP